MYQLPGGWDWVCLNDLQSDEPRAITDGPFGSNLTRAHYTASGPRVVRLQNIGDGIFNDARAHISEAHFESLRAHEVVPGDLLVASLGEVLPRACIAPAYLGPAIVKADCIRVRLSQEVDPRWVMYSMQRPQVRSWADDHRHGVGRPRLGLKVIRQIPVPLPPLDEQRRIVDILEDHLSRLDAAGATLNSVSAKAAAFRDTVLESAFFRRSASLGITRATVGEVADVDSGPAFASSFFVGPDSGTRLLRGDNIEPGRLRWDRTKAWPDSHLDGYRHLLVVRGDIILAMDRPVVTAGLKLARVTEADMPALLVQRVARIRPNSAVDDDYLYQVLSSRRFVQQLLGAQVGTQIPHITLKSIRLFAFDLPDVAEQHAIAATVRAHIESTDRVEHDTVVASKRSRSLRRALLAAAFSGRLTGRSSDMEMVEEMAGV